MQLPNGRNLATPISPNAQDRLYQQNHNSKLDQNDTRLEFHGPDVGPEMRQDLRQDSGQNLRQDLRQDLRHSLARQIPSNVPFHDVKRQIAPESLDSPQVQISPYTPPVANRMLPYLNSGKYQHIQPQLDHMREVPAAPSPAYGLPATSMTPGSNILPVAAPGVQPIGTPVATPISHGLTGQQPHIMPHPDSYVLPVTDDMDSLSRIHVMTPNHHTLSHLSTTLPQTPHGVPPDLDPAVYGEVELTRSGLFDSETSSRKVAPRSKDLFRVGPPFGITNIHRPLFCAATKEQIFPEMESRIDRGFELGEAGNWIGYKRNYFTMVLTFNFRGWNLDKFTENQYAILDKNDPSCQLPVKYFALSVLAKCSDPEVSIGLVQHTPKRDKGPQYSPPVYPAVPGHLPDHQTVKASCNKRNQKKIQTLGRIFRFNRADYYAINHMDPKKDKSVLSGYPTDEITRVARFERIQFTASIRVKQTTTDIHKYFTLNVELLAVVDDGERTLQIPVASCGSAPLLIRGRSPSNYPREKTSGYREKPTEYQ